MAVQIALLLIAIVTLFFVGIRLYLMDKNNPLYRILSFLCATTLVLAFCEYEFLRIETLEGTNNVETIYYTFLFNIACTPIIGWYYARMDEVEKYKKWTKGLLLINFLIPAIFVFLQLFTPYKFAELVNAESSGYGFDYIQGWIYYAWLVWVIALNIFSFSIFIYAYRKAEDGRDKYWKAEDGRDKYWKRINMIVVGIVITMVYMINVVLPLSGVVVSLFSVPMLTIVSVFFAWSFSDFKLFEISSDTAIQNIVETMSNMMVLTDTDLNIKEVNHAAVEMVGVPEKELIGKHIQEAFSLDAVAMKSTLKELEDSVGHRTSNEIDVLLEKKTLNLASHSLLKKLGFKFEFPFEEDGQDWCQYEISPG